MKVESVDVGKTQETCLGRNSSGGGEDLEEKMSDWIQSQAHNLDPAIVITLHSQQSSMTGLLLAVSGHYFWGYLRAGRSPRANCCRWGDIPPAP